MIKKKVRNQGIDFIRGIGIIIVFIGHAIQCNLLEGVLNSGTLIWERIILPIQMPLLFFVSGITCAYSLPLINRFDFLKKKANRLLVPYCCWAYIHYIIVCSIPTGYRIFSLKGLIEEFLKSDFWFLRYLCLLFIICALADYMANKIAAGSSFPYSLLIAVVFIVLTPFVEILSRIHIIELSLRTWYYLWFVFGIIVVLIMREYKDSSLIISQKMATSILGTILFVGISVCLLVELPEKVICVLIVINMTSFALVLCHENHNRIIDVISLIGKYTLPLYAIHWCLCFSPLWRLNIYTNSWFGVIPFWGRVLITLITWIIVSACLIRILNSNKYLRSTLLGISGSNR